MSAVPDARRPRHTTRRVDLPLDDEGEPRVNAWPDGIRTIGCLWCDRTFTSSGKQERMCPACRRHAGT